MKYDVVIRCRNEMEWLPRFISSLNNQSVKPSRIILVDNSSDVDFCEYARKENCVLLQYDKVKFNYSYALNPGIIDTCEDEVLIISAHCELMTSGSVQNMTKVDMHIKRLTFTEDKSSPLIVIQSIQEI
jgi:glycosyltransferase involved in cell wall biosynthesis